ncbi:hypothetical protein SI859A1_01271 [Aurantimonas manganoxydans SI85-9A1]|uniref:Uncharacterized protein n=1 Tax=Aurantimonas manganoxydans (strain ATCC BAA-1229 / DSM 21871 / SI85-9A1) TaxID=287752 RepID=Q1YJ49_AURMS|nr:hypothetical protein SI859A1_01271 [Aurantimonas manganoxydans SI85-9A1]
MNETPVRSNAIVNSAPGRASFTWQIAAPMPDPPWRSLEYSGQEPSAKAANSESVCPRPLPRDQSSASKASRHPRRSRSPRERTHWALIQMRTAASLRAAAKLSARRS